MCLCSLPLHHLFPSRLCPIRELMHTSEIFPYSAILMSCELIFSSLCTLLFHSSSFDFWRLCVCVCYCLVAVSLLSSHQKAANAHFSVGSPACQRRWGRVTAVLKCLQGTTFHSGNMNGREYSSNAERGSRCCHWARLNKLWSYLEKKPVPFSLFKLYIQLY